MIVTPVTVCGGPRHGDARWTTAGTAYRAARAEIRRGPATHFGCAVPPYRHGDVVVRPATLAERRALRRAEAAGAQHTTRVLWRGRPVPTAPR